MMILKRLIGEIMADMGFVTKGELEDALKRQRRIFEEEMLPERVQRARMVSDARRNKDTIPLLGQILLDMGFVTKEQLEAAIEIQEETFEEYYSLESEKLGIALEVGSIINSTLNLAEVLAHIMNQVNRLTNSVASTLMLLDDKSGELVLSVPTGPRADKLIDIRIPPGRGIAGWVAVHEETLLITDVKEDPRFYPEIDKISGFETKSLLCAPLKAKGKLIGVLEVINKIDGTSFTQKDVLSLNIFASQAAIAIENARLHGELKERLEQEIHVQKKLAISEKFRALGQMASGVAHEFNNLLMGIQGNTSLVLLEIDSESPNYDRLKNIEQAVLIGADLTKQLLGFARGGKYQVRPTNLNDLVEKSTQMFGRTKKEIKVYTKYQDGVHIVDVDREQIEQVLFNLYVNSWQAMPSGGELYIETENIILDDSLVKSLEIEPGKFVKVTVTDTGVGMDEATQKRIFDPFFTTKEMARGTGLGLASAYGIIKNHGGTINVHSQKGEGTTFNLYLPASEKEIIIERELPDEILKGKETILLVDDESMIIDVGKQLMEKMGYKVLTARDGKEAMEIFEKNWEEIDMVVLDMIMPGMGGGECFDRMKGIKPDIKVLLSSGYSIDGQATEILNRGCDGFIQKPFNIKEMSQKLREIIDRD